MKGGGEEIGSKIFKGRENPQLKEIKKRRGEKKSRGAISIHQYQNEDRELLVGEKGDVGPEEGWSRKRVIKKTHKKGRGGRDKY